MNFRVASLGLFIVAAGAFAGSPPAAPSIAAKMKTLSERWTRLAPLLFDDGADAAEVKLRLWDVKEAAKGVDLAFHLKGATNDPLLPLVAKSFESDLEQAGEIAAAGRVLQARQWARSALAACVTCHSRAGKGPRFELDAALEPVLKKSAWWDRAAFQAATRQFDPALDEIRKQLRAPRQPQSSLLEMEKAVRIGLMVAVRVKNDPACAAELADGVLASSWATPAMKERARVWKKDIDSWRKAPKAPPLATARALMSGEGDSGVRADDGDVRWLRSSALMHEFLTGGPTPDETAEAYFLLGNAYDQMGDLGYWNLADLYFDSCVREKPHSAIAEKCAARFEDSLVLGYTGSRGVDVPSAVRRRVEELKKLARPAR